MIWEQNLKDKIIINNSLGNIRKHNIIIIIEYL